MLRSEFGKEKREQYVRALSSVRLESEKRQESEYDMGYAANAPISSQFSSDTSDFNLQLKLASAT
jgi:hypothetical protein